MTILAKIEKNEDIYRKINFDLLEAGSISSFRIRGGDYELLTPFQAAALQKLGVGLGFYESNRTLYSQFPIVPRGTKVTRKERIKVHVENPEQLEQFVAKLEKRLTQYSGKH